jgi:hypothetical protein
MRELTLPLVDHGSVMRGVPVAEMPDAAVAVPEFFGDRTSLAPG